MRLHCARVAKANSPRTDIVFAHSATRINYDQQQQLQQKEQQQQQHKQQKEQQLAQQFGQRHQIIGFLLRVFYPTAPHTYSAGQVNRRTMRHIDPSLITIYANVLIYHVLSALEEVNRFAFVALLPISRKAAKSARQRQRQKLQVTLSAPVQAQLDSNSDCDWYWDWNWVCVCLYLA